MVYDVEVVYVDNGECNTLFTALIYAASVTECWKEAEYLIEKEYADRNGTLQIHVEESLGFAAV